MNRDQISKLQTIISGRLDRLVLELFPWAKPEVRGATPGSFLSGQYVLMLEQEWTMLCSDIGISSVEDDESAQKEIVVYNPMPRQAWLEMTRETALKILTLGMP